MTPKTNSQKIYSAKQYIKFPQSPGVYIFKDKRGRVLYIGKAGNLRRRVMSYFIKAYDYKIERLINEVRKVDFQTNDTAIEALILESQLIKKYAPPYNVREKDDKSFLYVEITKEKFPRVLLVRGKNRASGLCFGPFTSASSIREALRIIRRIFPFNLHAPLKIGKFERPCFDYELKLCPGTCIGKTDIHEYRQNIRNIKLLFQGKKAQILKSLKKEMNIAARKLEFEKAEKLKGKIFALKHIQDTGLIKDEEISNQKLENKSLARIEGYDISNISGTSAVGSMVVFIGGKPQKSEYRKFKIRTIFKSDDVGMLKEVLTRRFRRIPPAGARLPDGQGWSLPNLILIDGGKGQVNTAKKVLDEFGLRIPTVGIAKGPRRKKNEIVGIMPQGVDKDVLISVRNEAHRFAISYHKILRSKKFIG